MSSRVLACIVLLTVFAPVHAQEGKVAYVRDMLYIVMRDTPGDGEVVQTGITSGTRLDVLSEEGDFSRVRTTDGTIGWVQTQYLIGRPTARLQLQDMEAELQSVQAERNDLAETISLMEQMAGTEEGQAVDMTALRNELITLRNKADQAQQLGDDNERKAAEITRLEQSLKDQQVQVSILEEKARNTDLLYSAAAVLFGVFLALIVPLLKPRKRNEWA